MSSVYHRDEETIVVGTDHPRADRGAWADEPNEPDVFEAYAEGETFVVCAVDEAAQAIGAKHPVEIEQ